MTLNEISEQIAFSLGDQYNHVLKQAIKHTVIIHRAKLIGDSLDRNFLSYVDFLQSFTIEFEKVDKVEDYTCKILRSKNKVPTPLNIKQFGKSPFKYVGTITYDNAFVFANFDEFPYLANLPYQHNVLYYTWNEEYLYLLNNLKLTKAKVQAIFSDPRVINLSCTEKSQIFRDDREFPISMRMLSTIEKNIISGDYRIITDGKEVELEPEND